MITSLDLQDHSPETIARVAVTVFLGTFIITLAEVLFTKWLVPDTAEREYDMQEEIAALKKHAATLNNPDTFAQCAKAERKALALEKELERIRLHKSYAKSNYLLKLPLMARGMGMLALMFLSLEIPVVAYLPPKATWPFGRFLATSTGLPSDIGAVGLIPWALLSHRVSKSILKKR